MFKKFTLFISIFCVGIATAFASTSFGDYSLNTVYDGYGSVDLNVSLKEVKLNPKVATAIGDTHAALVVSNESLSGNYEIAFTVENIAQLRKNSSPNAWEAPWFVFGYNDTVDSSGAPDQTFNYVIFKPNGYGLELGEALTNDAQNFLWTSTVGSDSYNVGTSYNAVLKVENDVISLKVDGIEKFSFADTSKKKLGLTGKFGFYSEDADVKFSNIQVSHVENASSEDSTINLSSTGTFAGSATNLGGVDRHKPPKQINVKRAYNFIERDYSYLRMQELRRELKRTTVKKNVSLTPLPSFQKKTMKLLKKGLIRIDN